MKIMRTYDILEYVKKKKRCTVAELMEKFNASSATIHRDIATLVSRVIANRVAKEKIAEQALSHVTEGDILFLDSSTTVLAFALRLKRATFHHLTILTNSVSIIQNFRKFPQHWVLIGLGGNYDPQLNSIIGQSAINQLSAFNVTKAFVSAFGIDEKTATTNHERQAELIKHVLDSAEKSYLLADKTKFGRKGLYRLSSRGAFTSIISDVRGGPAALG